MKNELKNHSEMYIKVIGLNTLLLLSTDVFPKNADIKQYTNKYFSFEPKDYLFKSRTLLVARTNRYIYNLDIDEVINLYNNIKSYIEKPQENKKSKNHPAGKRAKDNLKTWLEKM